jgi:DNA-binding NtrC family response regulator
VAEPVGSPVSAEAAPAVLVIDDDPTARWSLSRLLRPMRANVYTASGAEEALTLLERHAPGIGVVISDYSMPRVSGTELLRAVRERWPDVVRIMLTGQADVSVVAAAVNEGQVSRLYLKPCEPEVLLQAVSAGLEQYRVTRENVAEQADRQAAALLGVQAAQRVVPAADEGGSVRSERERAKDCRQPRPRDRRPAPAAVRSVAA